MAQIDEPQLQDDHSLGYHLHAIAVKLTPKPILDMIALVLIAYQHVLLAIQRIRDWRMQIWSFVLSVDFRLLLRQVLGKMMGIDLSVLLPTKEKEKDASNTKGSIQKKFFDAPRTICRLLVEGNLEKLQEYSNLSPGIGFKLATRYGWTPLHTAVCTGDPRLVSFILAQEDVDVNFPATTDFENNRPPDGVIETELCKEPFDDFIKENTKGASPLHFACMFGHVDIIKILIDHGASYFVLDELNRRPIQYFQSAGPALAVYQDLYKLWYRRTALLDITNGVIRLQQAVVDQDMIAFEALLSGRPEHLTTKTAQGWTLLHLTVIRKFRPFITAILKHTAGNKAFINEIDTWSDPEQRWMLAGDEYPHRYVRGGTALHYACLTGDFEIIKELLSAGADWRRVDAHGRDPKFMLVLDPDGKDKTRFQELCDEQAKRGDKDKEGTGGFQLVDDPIAEDGWGVYGGASEGWRAAPIIAPVTTPLEKTIGEKIIGQKGPIRSVCSAIRLRENGWVDPERPLVMLFLGSSGVGKTELAKQVALYSHSKTLPPFVEKMSITEIEKENAFIRLDMTEYQQSHTVANLFGSPKGYVGYEEGGMLSSKLQANPKAVVLLDEIEKAHPDVLTVFLQVFGDGRLTDAKSGTVYCQDAVFIMTSNLASKEIKENAPFLRKLIDESDDRPEEYNRFIGGFNRRIYPVLKKAFKRDEFLGRINQTIVFLPLSESEIHNVIANELSTWKNRASEKHGIAIDWAREVIQKLARSYDVNYGVRSVLNEVNKVAVQIVAEAHIRGDLEDGWLVYLTLNGVGDIVMRSMDPSSEVRERRGCRLLVG